MKLDLWKCDRCGQSKESPPQLGLPSGWVSFTTTKRNEGRGEGGSAIGSTSDKHFCERCSAEFHAWLKQEPTVPEGKITCPDCSATLLVKGTQVQHAAHVV